MPESFAASSSPVDVFDVALLDLDGVVYLAEQAVPHAVESLVECHGRGVALAYVTNNASRTPTSVAEHLRELGLPARDEDVVTSAQAGARVMTRLVPAGARVLAVGGPGVDAALLERGLVPVRSIDAQPVAVMQGFGRDITWSQLADAAYVLGTGVPWVATNLDPTFPTLQGRAPGNGSMVSALITATGRRPDAVAGKPERPLVEESILRTGAKRPVMVGDRLDTDIEAATRTGIPSLLVLTGVTHAAELLAAPAALRPSLLSLDLRGLLVAHPEVIREGDTASCGAARAVVREAALVLDGPADSPEDVAALWRVAATLAWSVPCDVTEAVARMDAGVRALL